MNPTSADVNRAVSQAKLRESQGYFERVRAGDRRAASLFVRMIADDLNPLAVPSGYGWLTKQPGETQVDGYAEDAIVYGNDPADLLNVVDLVIGAGAPDASIGGAVKERRPANRWEAPRPLTDAEVAYLRAGGLPQPVPPPTPTYPPYPGDLIFDAVGVALFSDYAKAGYGPDPQMGRWFGRTIYDWLAQIVGSLPESIAKHQLEWRDGLNQRRASEGLPPIAW